MSVLGRWAQRSYRRRLLDADLAEIAGRMSGRVLEIGAGRTWRRGMFRPPRESVSAWWTVDVRRDRGPHVAADLRRLPFRDASVDTVVCLEVLEYVDDAVAALQEARRVLRPGGALVLSTPFMHRWDAEDDLWRWTAAGLRRVLAQAGFTVVAERAQGGALAVVANVLSQAVRAAPPRPVRGIVMLLAWPFLELLFRLDGATARRSEHMRSHATGYLVTARRD